MTNNDINNEVKKENTEIEFMRKSRFEKIQSKFSEISPEAKKVISDAHSEDILSLTLSFNSPIKVIEAEIFDDKKFIELAF